MKRFSVAMLIALPFLSGCVKTGDGSTDNPPANGRKIVINAEINNELSRTSHSWSNEGLATVWSEADNIAVFNDKISGHSTSVAFSLTGGAGTATGKFEGTLPEDGAGTYYAAYPFVEGGSYERVPFDMTAPQIHSGELDDMTHLSSHGIMYGSFTTDGNGTVTSPLSFEHLTAAFKFNIALPEAGRITMVQFRAKDSSKEPFIVKGTFDASSGTVDETSAIHSNSVGVYMDGADAVSECSAIMMFIPANIAGLEMEVVVAADGKAYRKEIVIPSGKVLKSGVCYNLPVDCSAVVPVPVITVYAPGTLSTKLTGMKDITELKVNTVPGVELSASDFNAISEALQLTALDISGISNKVLPGKITSSYFWNIKSIILPSSLETIGQYAFSQSAIKGVFVIPAGVTQIGDFAFQNCPKLTGLHFAERTEQLTVGTNVFAGCANLAGEISLPPQLINIGDFMFANCNKITSVNYPAFLKPVVMGTSAFQDCKGLASISIPAMVVEVGASAFSGCTAANAILFESRTEPLTLSKSSFRNNPALSGKLEMPVAVTEIGNYAFVGCAYNSDSDKTMGIYFTSTTPPVIAGVNALFGQRVFVASEEMKAAYEANQSWKGAIPYMKDAKLFVGTVD